MALNTKSDKTSTGEHQSLLEGAWSFADVDGRKEPTDRRLALASTPLHTRSAACASHLKAGVGAGHLGSQRLQALLSQQVPDCNS